MQGPVVVNQSVSCSRAMLSKTCVALRPWMTGKPSSGTGVNLVAAVAEDDGWKAGGCLGTFFLAWRGGKGVDFTFTSGSVILSAAAGREILSSRGGECRGERL